jgi:hypothetical protein
MTDAVNRRAKANRELTGRVQVPVEALMTGTPSRTVRVSAARRNLKEAAGKLLVRGTRTASEATARGARGRKDSKPHVIRSWPAYMRRICGRKVTRLTLRDLSTCRKARAAERRSDGPAEVSRGHSKRGQTDRSIGTLTGNGRNSSGSQVRTATMKGRTVRTSLAQSVRCPKQTQT